MRVIVEPLVAGLTISAVFFLNGCRGADHDVEGRAEVLYMAASNWDESNVLGFAAAAFSVLAADGELGAASARRPVVRRFAARMRRDYRALAARTDSLARAHGVTPERPAGLEFVREHQEAAIALRNEERRKFDDLYLQHVVSAHEQVMDGTYDALSAAQSDTVRRMLEEAQEQLERYLGDAIRLRLERTRPRPMWRPEA